jgi:hypothetical protein
MFWPTMNPSNPVALVLMKPKVSRLPAVVVSVGAEPPAHLIVENQVAVLEPVASWVSETIHFTPFTAPVTVSVQLPVPKVTRCSWPWVKSMAAVPALPGE